ncbi:MAG: serine hydrolase [Chitinophagaceae bacterium]|nr:serine hydrolase [Chitinophagaceae bacterium]
MYQKLLFGTRAISYRYYTMVLKRLGMDILFLVVVSLFSCNRYPVEDTDFLRNLMLTKPSQFDSLLAKKDVFEIQILYTQINRDEQNIPHFKSFSYNMDRNMYFYPASTVKLPLVLLSLEKLHELGIAGLNKYTRMLSDSVYSGQLSVHKDTTSEDGYPSVAHYSKKILIVSDNDAYNRLYEFMGQREINRRLQKKGYRVSFLHRLERPLSLDENRYTEAIRFIDSGDTNKVIYRQEMGENVTPFFRRDTILKGRGYINRNGELVMAPFDFTYKNSYPLEDQQEVLKALLFPKAVASYRTFNISEEDRHFVLQYMSQYPHETYFPPYYKDSSLYDSYCKFLLFGEGTKKIPHNIRIFNKVGDAYGYLIDNAYIVDFDRQVEFLLSAVIHTNSDGIFNDGKYEYSAIGFPFMKNIGQLLYEYELQRKKKRKPDLWEFRFMYDYQ